MNARLLLLAFLTFPLGHLVAAPASALRGVAASTPATAVALITASTVAPAMSLQMKLSCSVAITSPSGRRA